ncbi:MAG: xseA [Clostridiaceae bacterium]|jgi:exodeoxyribonuclease VII large subunit|nr:xseA [Clostridiaceae bacterium]
MFIKTLTVSALNNYIKKIMDNDFILGNLSIKGEISNFKLHSSGHLYFSLKDEVGKINCIMFKNNAEKLNFTPEDGAKVIVRGRVSVYQKDGAYQLYCEHMDIEGLGELYVEFEKMKAKLEKQGLFALEHKRQIPKYAKKIGVVTSPTGAAIRDIINVSKRRNPLIELIIYPALVQGNNAEPDIIKGISELNKYNDIDVIILARGGGSIEELWSFNEENVAKAIYDSKIPIVTGIGHETDFTIADFVSDKRAPTPSAAAEIAVFNLSELNNQINSYQNSIKTAFYNKIENSYSKVHVLSKSLELNSPANFIINEYTHIDSNKSLLEFKMNNKININKEKLSRLNSLLSAHNPLNVLNKGYSVIEDPEDKIVTEVKVLEELKEFKVILKDGNINIKKAPK